jgi:hypothetical protein
MKEHDMFLKRFRLHFFQIILGICFKPEMASALRKLLWRLQLTGLRKALRAKKKLASELVKSLVWLFTEGETVSFVSIDLGDRVGCFIGLVLRWQSVYRFVDVENEIMTYENGKQSLKRGDGMIKRIRAKPPRQDG